MQDNLVAYVQWKIIGQWKRLTLKHAHAGKPIFGYGSDDKRQFKDYAKDGANLWLIATHRDLPPTLMGVLRKVERIRSDGGGMAPIAFVSELLNPKTGQDYRFKVLGDKTSVFFGHNDASGVLKDLRFLGSSGRTVKRKGVRWIPKKHGCMLQRPHRVHDAEPLENHAKSLREQSVFISWKHTDVLSKSRACTARCRRVKRFVRCLNRHGFAVWLDALALPNYKPNTRDDRLMDLLLKQGLRDSRAVVAVASPAYGCTSPKSKENWTKLEWESKRPRFRAVFPVDGSLPPARTCPKGERGVQWKSADLHLPQDPERAADEFCPWFSGFPRSRTTARSARASGSTRDSASHPA